MVACPSEVGRCWTSTASAHDQGPGQGHAIAADHLRVGVITPRGTVPACCEDPSATPALSGVVQHRATGKPKRRSATTSVSLRGGIGRSLPTNGRLRSLPSPVARVWMVPRLPGRKRSWIEREHWLPRSLEGDRKSSRVPTVIELLSALNSLGLSCTPVLSRIVFPFV
jgi:hypothetical protein